MSGTIPNIKWDLRFLGLAQNPISTWSKDPSTQVGAVITDGKEIVSVGYNGFPADVEDKPEWYHDRDKKLSLMVHAEVNAKRIANRPLLGCTLYTYPFLPCRVCAEEFIGTGIKRAVSLKNTEARWDESINAAKNRFQMAGIEVDDMYAVQKTLGGLNNYIYRIRPEE